MRIMLALCVLLAGCATAEADQGSAITGWRTTIVVPSQTEVKQVGTAETTILLTLGAALVDVRSKHERGNGDVAKDSIWIPFTPKVVKNATREEGAEFVARALAHFPRNQMLILICEQGIRSDWAGKVLLQHGFTRVMNFAGGMWGNSQHAGGWVMQMPLQPQLSNATAPR